MFKRGENKQQPLADLTRKEAARDQLYHSNAKHKTA